MKIKLFFLLLALMLALALPALAQQPVGLYNLGGTALGAPSNYGTSPGAVAVLGVNAFVTNTVGTNIAQVNAVALGSPSAYGTSPGAVNVLGVNAFVTNAGSIGTPTPSTSSTYAFTRYHATSSTSAGLNIKASAGNLYGFSVFNPNTTPCYLQFYNNAGTPTVGTSVVDSFGVQAGLTLSVNPGTLALENFATGIAYATATTDAGATECTTAMSVTVFYQ